MAHLRRLALAAAILAPGFAFPPGAAGAEDPAPLTVADFESPAVAVAWRASSFERVPDSPGGAGHAAKWVIPGEDRDPILFLESAPADITPWRFVRFRMRRETDAPHIVFLRVFSGAEGTRDEFQVRVPGVGKEWRTFEIDLDSLTEVGSPNPRAIRSIGFGIVKGPAAVFLVDDVVLDVKRLPVDPDAAKRAGEKTWTVADFEAPAWGEWTEAKASTVAVAEEKGGKVLRWSLDAGGNPAAAYTYDVPRGLRDWRTLRFRIRAEGDPGAVVCVRFTAGFQDCLQWEIKSVARKWTDVEIPVSLMEELGTFDIARLECLSFQVFKGAACTIFLDDLRLERGATDAAAAEKDRFEYAFGKGGAGKGIHVAAGEFDLWTDSRAAVSKFPEGLEKAAAFVREALVLPAARRRLDVYLFQNPGGLRDFLVRARGFEKKKAEGLAAVGNANYLALVYRAPDDPQFVHELAHCLFHRARGRKGGSWFQEGVGTFVEMRWLKKSPAAEFAPRLRSKAFVPLAAFVAIPDLFAGTDEKGGAGTSDSLFLQAAALHEFLRRGPLRDRWGQAEAGVAHMDAAPADRAAALEKLLGMSIADLQKAWVEWGSDPPKE
jgi:hypothetical protein